MESDNKKLAQELGLDKVIDNRQPHKVSTQRGDMIKSKLKE